MGPQHLLSISILFLLLSSPLTGWAFPSTPILDTFAGCVDTTTPPNSNWTNTIVTGASSSTVDCEDQAVTSTTSSVEGEIYWNATDFNADCEVYGTIASLTSFVSADLGCRIVNKGSSTTDGYSVQVTDADNIIRLRRYDNGVATVIGSTAQTLAAGDSFGVKMTGNQICSWYKVAAGAWAQIQCVTDATYSAGGSLTIGVSGNGGIGILNNVGGGTTVVGSSTGSMMRRRFTP